MYLIEATGETAQTLSAVRKICKNKSLPRVIDDEVLESLGILKIKTKPKRPEVTLDQLKTSYIPSNKNEHI